MQTCMFVVQSIYVVPLMLQLFESAKVLLDAGEEIPCDLLVSILKSQLQQLQEECLQRIDTETVGVRSTLTALNVY